MTAGPRLILIGLRASGKSTLGAMLADRIGATFVDLDDRTAGALNAASCAEALKERGEQRFRAVEAETLKSALAETGTILALGGGTPTAPGAAELLRESDSPVAYLHASPADLAARLERTDIDSRPSLTGRGTVEEIAELYGERDPLYRELAARVIETADLDLDRILGELESMLA
ncbi:MAG: shikimate kinase [Planctomycetota bacterium]